MKYRRFIKTTGWTIFFFISLPDSNGTSFINFVKNIFFILYKCRFFLFTRKWKSELFIGKSPALCSIVYNHRFFQKLFQCSDVCSFHSSKLPARDPRTRDIKKFKSLDRTNRCVDPCFQHLISENLSKNLFCSKKLIRLTFWLTNKNSLVTETEQEIQIAKMF